MQNHDTHQSAAEKKPQTWGFRVQRYLRHLALHILVYFLVYLLVAFVSIGPFFWYWHEAVYMGGAEWIARFYMPLLLLCELFPWFGDLVDLYINWWIL